MPKKGGMRVLVGYGLGEPGIEFLGGGVGNVDAQFVEPELKTDLPWQTGAVVTHNLAPVEALLIQPIYGYLSVLGAGAIAGV